MNRSRFAALSLPAGEAPRLNAATPKVVHEIAGRPMSRYVMDALAPLEPAETMVVIGPEMDAVDRTVWPATTIVQSPARGTGDAVRVARAALADRLAQGDIADVLVLFGDAPLLRS